MLFINNITDIKNNRDNDIKIKIDKIKINNNDDFNNIFNSKFYNQIVKYYDTPTELTNYIYGNTYTNLEDINKLYINDTIQNSEFTSLDNAFIL